MKVDFCILGGGVMGLATAHSILKTGRPKVLVLDRFGVGNEYSSSNDVNRVFRYSYGNDELYTRMAAESLRLWNGLEKESGQELLVPTGLLLLHGDDESANGFNEASYRTLSGMRLGVERLDETELRRRFPQFNSNGAILDQNGGVLRASKALTAFHSLARAKGADLERAHAKEIVAGDHPYVTTARNETVEFRKLIVTIGPWSSVLLRSEFPTVQPTRQQLVYFRPRHGMDRFRPSSCPIFFTDKHYGLPAAGIEAVKVSSKDLPEKADPETTNWSVDEKEIIECREACRRFVPGIADGEVVRTKVCLYDMTQNSDFVLDRDPDYPNIVYGYGFSGHGFKFAPLIGDLLAQLALDKKPSFDLDRFSAVPSRRRTPILGAHLGKGE